MAPRTDLVSMMTSCLVCANTECLVSRSAALPLQLCSGCSGVAYCGEKCQQEGWVTHSVVCNKMKGVSWEERVKQVSAMISLAKEDKNESHSSSCGTDEDDDESDSDEVTVDLFPKHSSVLKSSKVTNPNVSWNVSLSPIRQPSGSIQTFCLVRFSCLSSHTWNRELDVIVVKVWQDMELTSIGVFLPVDEEEEREEKVKFKLFSSKGQMMYKQEEDVAELYATDLDKMGEMKFTRPVKLSAHRKYFLVMKMSGMTCSAGEGGSYLHCLQTEKGGVQVAFETPEKDDLEEFLEDVENHTNTFRGQIPALFLRVVEDKK